MICVPLALTVVVTVGVFRSRPPAGESGTGVTEAGVLGKAKIIRVDVAEPGLTRSYTDRTDIVDINYCIDSCKKYICQEPENAPPEPENAPEEPENLPLAPESVTDAAEDDLRDIPQSGGGEEDTNKKNQSVTADKYESFSQTGLLAGVEIILTDDEGGRQVYVLEGNKLVDTTYGETYELPPEKVTELKNLLGLE